MKFPATLAKIESAAFHGCSSLADVSFLSFPDVTGTDVFGGTKSTPYGRLTYPANSVEWTELFANLNPVLWANASNDYKNKYQQTFTDGLTPSGYATYHPKAETTFAVSKWFVPVPVVSKEIRLGIQGTPVACGEVTPAYGDQGVIETFPVVCSAPQYTIYGDKVYECIGYRYGQLVGTEIEYGETVASRTFNFEPSEAGDYYVQWQWQIAAYQADVLQVPAGMGVTVAIDEQPFEGFTGYYTAGAAVTIRPTGAADAPFVRWYGDVPAGHETDNPLVLTVEKPFSVRAYFAHDWTYAKDTVTGGYTITDGYWTFSASGAPEGIFIGAMTGLAIDIGMLDFRKPVWSDSTPGTFVTMQGESCYGKIGSSSIREVRFADTITNIMNSAMRELSNLTHVQLPTGLKFIADAAFKDSKMITMTPLLPVDTVVDGAAFCGCSRLTGDLVIASKRQTELKTHSGSSSLGVFKDTQFSSVDLTQSKITRIGTDCFRNCSKLGAIFLPKTLVGLAGSQFYQTPNLTNLVFRSFPKDGFPSDSFGTDMGYKRRIVYPKGDAGWEQYIAARDSFVPWAEAGNVTNDYLKAFGSRPKPVGHLIHEAGTTYGNTRFWMVPQSTAGSVIFLR